MEIDDALEELKLSEVQGDIYTFEKIKITPNELGELPEFLGW